MLVASICVLVGGRVVSVRPICPRATAGCQTDGLAPGHLPSLACHGLSTHFLVMTPVHNACDTL